MINNIPCSTTKNFAVWEAHLQKKRNCIKLDVQSYTRWQNTHLQKYTLNLTSTKRLYAGITKG